MKLKVDAKLVEEIRTSIKNSRAQMSENRARRKEHITQIRNLKANIKRGETLCSKLEAGLVADVSYVRDDLKNKRRALDKVRNELLVAEFQYAISQSVCRAVHRMLDQLNEPFDPQRAKSAGRK